MLNKTKVILFSLLLVPAFSFADGDVDTTNEYLNTGASQQMDMMDDINKEIESKPTAAGSSTGDMHDVAKENIDLLQNPTYGGDL